MLVARVYSVQTYLAFHVLMFQAPPGNFEAKSYRVIDIAKR